MNHLPQRPQSHVTGDEAVRLFVAACPRQWVVSPVMIDYGLDLRVEFVRNGAVTGEEFLVQVKGRRRQTFTHGGSVKVTIKTSTLNYWLGKLHPIMIVSADTSEGRLWYGWLDQVYHNYPERIHAELKIELLLTSRIDYQFEPAIGSYIAEYFSNLQRDRLLLDRVQLSRFSLHMAGITSALTRIHLALTSGQPIEKLQEHLDFLFFEYGCHDSFLLSLCELESPWRQNLTSRIATIVFPALEKYVALRETFWMREKRIVEGVCEFIPFSYSALCKHLIPTLEAAWVLQSTVNELLVLGSAPSIAASHKPPINTDSADEAARPI